MKSSDKLMKELHDYIDNVEDEETWDEYLKATSRWHTP